MNKKFWLSLLLLATVGIVIHARFWQISAAELSSEDIYFIWLEGKRILLGENPYERVLAGDLRINDKYATYFPVVYILSAAFQQLGFTEFNDWLYIWRPISYVFHMGVVALILRVFQQRHALLMGIVASMIMLLGRWSLYILQVHHIEFAAIFFLLLSFFLLSRRPKLALLLYSLSLGIKQIGIFLLPLYLIFSFKSTDKPNKLRESVIGLLLVISIPMATTIPFLIWNPEGFLKSILFSATRLSDLHINEAPSIDVLAAQVYPWVVGFRAKVLMLLLIGMTYLSFSKEKISILMASSMTMMIFLYFNSVLFLQYFVWPLSLILLAFAEVVRPLPTSESRT